MVLVRNAWILSFRISKRGEAYEASCWTILSISKVEAVREA